MNNSDLSCFLTALTENGLRFAARETIPEGTPLTGRFNKVFYKPHTHTQMEMICLLKGSLALNINGVWRVCPTMLAQVFIPGAVHGEHYLAPEKGYRMLWATVFPAALFFHLTEYQPLTGYSTSRKRMAITPPMCAQLWESARALTATDNSTTRAKFHCLLMECVHFFLTEQDADKQAADYHEEVVEQVKRYVNEYYWQDISLSAMAEIVRYSSGHLNAVFRKAEDMPVHRYINEVRLERARQLLSAGEMLVKQVARAAGFRDPLYFSRMFTRRFGIRPEAFLKRAGARKAGTVFSPDDNRR